MERLDPAYYEETYDRVRKLRVLERELELSPPARTIARTLDIRQPQRGLARRLNDLCRREWPHRILAKEELAREAALTFPGVQAVETVDEGRYYRCIINTVEGNGETHQLAGPACGSRALAVCAAICKMGHMRLWKRVEDEFNLRRREKKQASRIRHGLDPADRPVDQEPELEMPEY